MCMSRKCTCSRHTASLVFPLSLPSVAQTGWEMARITARWDAGENIYPAWTRSSGAPSPPFASSRDPNFLHRKEICQRSRLAQGWEACCRASAGVISAPRGQQSSPKGPPLFVGSQEPRDPADSDFFFFSHGYRVER